MRAKTMQEAVQIVLDYKGYFVIAFNDGPEPVPQIGEVLRIPIWEAANGDDSIDGPFLCVGHATKDEFIQQGEFLGLPPDAMEIVRQGSEDAIAFVKLVAE